MNANHSTRQQILDLYRDAIKNGMSVEDVQVELQEFNQMVAQVQHIEQREKRLTTKYWHLRRILPMVLITVGSVLVANAVWPILFYTLFVAPKLQRVELSTPVPEENVIARTDSSSDLIAANAAKASGDELVKPKPKPVILKQELDYSNLANWFTDSTQIAATAVEEQKEYFIDIPALGIEKASVKVGGTDLNRNLIQYPNTAEPGEFGAPVIFGHSVLRQFYKPQLTNPNRYKSIFSKIMTLEQGDKIYITYEGVKYTYAVQEKHEVNPEDTYILQQRHSARELKLITCVPEGTYLHRGVVLSKLEKVE